MSSNCGQQIIVDDLCVPPCSLAQLQSKLLINMAEASGGRTTQRIDSKEVGLESTALSDESLNFRTG
jgi:hypothetical protein